MSPAFVWPVLASIAFLCTSNSCFASAEPPTATIASGVIFGTSTQLPSATINVDKYLGVPFARPPQRFAPPVEARPWSTPLNATNYKPACIQQKSGIFSRKGVAGESEDCLYLNIYVPSKEAPAEGFPVLFWIYGGNLQFGDAAIPAYDGSSFANFQDVIVVTTNYRTNVFGYPNSPALPRGYQNLGFLDQRFALRWVATNINAFGGNPAKVTIFGESAGGYSVKQLIAAPPRPLPFRAAIMQSEAATFQNGAQSWARLVAALNCSTPLFYSEAASAQQELRNDYEITCVRRAPATQIQSILENSVGYSFGPVTDNTTQHSNVIGPITAGTAAKVPILIGTNANEGRAFTTGSNQSLAQFLSTNFVNQTQYAAAIAAQYPSSDPRYSNNFRATAAVITDLSFQCPAAALSNLTAEVGNPTFRYFFNASFPNYQPFPDIGVFHASEIPEVFGTYNTTGATDLQASLSKSMQTAWADFAKDPVKGPGWPRLGSVVKDFGTNGMAEGSLVEAMALDVNCPIFGPALAVLGL